MMSEGQSIKEKSFVFVCGYGWSGSSALVDFLKEIEGFSGLDKEFRLIKERFGLIDLENHLVHQYDPLESDLSIKNFLWLAKSYDRIPGKLSRYGMAYRNYFGNDFLEETYNFVNRLVEYKYKNYWFYFAFNWGAKERLIKRIKAKLNPSSILEDCFFPKQITEEEFDTLTKDYLRILFVNHSKSNVLIMDQSVPANHYDYAFKYFDNAKVILVDRDPRDIYSEMVRQKQLIGYDLSLRDDANKYILWHKMTRNIVGDNGSSKVLRIRFEDLVLDYNKTSMEIYKFLDIQPEMHTNKRKLFNPDISQKNIGIWKSYHDQSVMEEIKEALGDCCYER